MGDPTTQALVVWNLRAIYALQPWGYLGRTLMDPGHANPKHNTHAYSHDRHTCLPHMPATHACHTCLSHMPATHAPGVTFRSPNRHALSPVSIGVCMRACVRVCMRACVMADAVLAQAMIGTSQRYANTSSVGMPSAPRPSALRHCMPARQIATPSSHSASVSAVRAYVCVCVCVCARARVCVCVRASVRACIHAWH